MFDTIGGVLQYTEKIHEFSLQTALQQPCPFHLYYASTPSPRSRTEFQWPSFFYPSPITEYPVILNVVKNL